MKTIQNVLYVTIPTAYLSLDGENVVIQDDKEVVGRIPFHNINGIVSFGYRGASPALMGACAERQIGLSFLTRHGRFLARISGPVNGNVLLRTAQYQMTAEPPSAMPVAKMFLIGKIYNGRWSIERAKRDHAMRVDVDKLSADIEQMKLALDRIKGAQSRDELMGIEGNAAKAYFDAFPQLILKNRSVFSFDGRTRRPPLDPVNAMLSFVYTLLGNEIAGALETVGLDPAVGFLHTLRPGRSSLALDMLEELRAPLADRFVLSLINLGKITEKDFDKKENGAVYLTDKGRRTFLDAWFHKKQETLTHPYLQEKMQWGLVPHVQAMLLARYIRGDLDVYPPFMWK